jgi:hypothetical protein
MKSNDDFLAEERAIRQRLADGPDAALRALPGVVHVSVGLKEVEGRLRRDDLCVRVYVSEKRPADALDPAHRVPVSIGGIATDVHAIADVSFQADNTRYRPLQGGIQITNRIAAAFPAGSPADLRRGTLGCCALDTQNKNEVFLSNWHVLYANGGNDGDKIYQPAPLWLPPLTAAQLPFRPADENDKVAVSLRGKVTDKVDAAIARIYVSSCCHCCGIHYSNEIRGLSAGGHPTRNTIVGDQPAAAGMKVFKVGQATLRTEGTVVDANYAEFTIDDTGTPRKFKGQIAIQHVDHSKQFSDIGDSGAVVVTDDNKIVGLLFAAGKNVPASGGGAAQPFVSFANHIADVFTALEISIPYSSDVKVLAGQTLEHVPQSVHEAQATVPEPYRALRRQIEAHEATARLVAIGERHRDEVMSLVNERHRVTIAWHKCEGPALLASVMSAVRDGHYRLPSSVKGLTLVEALQRMRAVIAEHGSAALRQTMGSPDAELVLQACEGATDLNMVIERIAQ